MAQHIVTPRSPPHAALQCCPRAWAALVCSALRAPRLQRAGLLGPTPCLSCTLVVATPQPAALPSSPKVLLRPPRACALLRRPAACSTAPTGPAARPGATFSTTCARHNAICPSLASGARAGSITVPALALPTSAKPSCSPPRQPLLRSQSGPHAAAWLSRPTACS